MSQGIGFRGPYAYPMTAEQPQRRRIRFSLRTLFVVLTLFGVWLGWEMYVVRKRQAVRAWAERRGAEFSTDEHEKMWLLDEYSRHPERSQKSFAIPFVRRLFGDEAVVSVRLSLDEKEEEEVGLKIAPVFPEAELLLPRE